MVFANKCVLAVCGQQHISALSQLYAVCRFLPAQAAVATTMFPFDIHSYCVEISTLVWEKLFLPLQLKTISITQLKPHVICLCRVKETNQCMVVASKPINMRPAIARQNGRGVWLYNPPPATASQISSLQRRRPFMADSLLTPSSAVETPQQQQWCYQGSRFRYLSHNKLYRV